MREARAQPGHRVLGPDGVGQHDREPVVLLRSGGAGRRAGRRAVPRSADSRRGTGAGTCSTAPRPSAPSSTSQEPLRDRPRRRSRPAASRCSAGRGAGPAGRAGGRGRCSRCRRTATPARRRPRRRAARARCRWPRPPVTQAWASTTERAPAGGRGRPGTQAVARPRTPSVAARDLRRSPAGSGGSSAAHGLGLEVRQPVDRDLAVLVGQQHRLGAAVRGRVRTCTPAASTSRAPTPRREAESWLPLVTTTRAPASRSRTARRRRDRRPPPAARRGRRRRRRRAPRRPARRARPRPASRGRRPARPSRSDRCRVRPRCQSEVCSSRMGAP